LIRASYRAGRTKNHLEILGALLGTALLSILCVRIEAVEKLAAFVKRYEAWPVDGAIVVLLCAGVAVGFMLVRRSGDLRREVARRRVAEKATADLSRESLSYNMAERRLLEEAVRVNEQRLASILATAHQSMVTIDQHGIVSGWNRHAELTFGWSADEAIGRRMSELIVPPEMRAAHEGGLARFMRSLRSVPPTWAKTGSSPR
jgi:PAS domain-containing protein